MGTSWAWNWAEQQNGNLAPELPQETFPDTALVWAWSSLWCSEIFCLELTWAEKIRIQMLVVPPLFPGGVLRKGQWCWWSHKLYISDSFSTGNKQGIESSWACLGHFSWILFLSTKTQIRSTLLKLGRYFIIYLSNWWEISETHGSKSICCC